MRAVIEGRGCGMSIEYGWSREELATLDERIAAGREIVERGDWSAQIERQWYEINRDIHAWIVRVGRNPAIRSVNHSIAGNLKWEAPGGVTIELDYHHSSATSKPANKYGTSVSVGNSVFGVANQRINFESDLPVISYEMFPGIDPLDASLITPTGNRSEARRVGKECVSTCRSRWSPCH